MTQAFEWSISGSDNYFIWWCCPFHDKVTFSPTGHRLEFSGWEETNTYDNILLIITGTMTISVFPFSLPYMNAAILPSLINYHRKYE